jgi:hypothetical protein
VGQIQTILNIITGKTLKKKRRRRRRRRRREVGTRSKSNSISKIRFVRSFGLIN